MTKAGRLMVTKWTYPICKLDLHLHTRFLLLLQICSELRDRPKTSGTSSQSGAGDAYNFDEDPAAMTSSPPKASASEEPRRSTRGRRRSGPDGQSGTGNNNNNNNGEGEMKSASPTGEENGREADDCEEQTETVDTAHTADSENDEVRI